MGLSFLKKPIAKNILSGLVVALFGFILLVLTFLFDFLFQTTVIKFIELFTQVDFEAGWQWFPPTMHGLFALIVGVISWFVFHSKLRVLYRAIFMPVPLVVVFATIGIFLYQWPIAVYSLGGLFFIGIFYFFYYTKQPWLYYYTLFLVGLAMLFIGLSGAEI